jgi:hypothetical protein
MQGMRIVHPVTLQSLAAPIRKRTARRMPPPSRLPTLVPTQPSVFHRLLRSLGLGRWLAVGF